VCASDSLEGVCIEVTDTPTNLIKIQISTDLLKDTRVEFAIQGIQNPRTFQPTDSIYITSYDTDGVAKIDEGFKKNVQMTNAGTITQFDVSRESEMNGIVNTYTFTVRNDVPLLPNDVLKFFVPPQVTFSEGGSGALECLSNDDIECYHTDDEYTIILKNLAD
jgi:hypothetical protein